MKNKSRNQNRIHRKRRTRAKILGNAKRPRLCVFRSLQSIYAQVIDDQKGKTLFGVDSRKMKGKDVAKQVGIEVAKLAKKNKISEIVFDKGGYKFHGKVKAVADGAREGGLKF